MGLRTVRQNDPVDIIYLHHSACRSVLNIVFATRNFIILCTRLASCSYIICALHKYGNYRCYSSAPNAGDRNYTPQCYRQTIIILASIR